MASPFTRLDSLTNSQEDGQYGIAQGTHDYTVLSNAISAMETLVATLNDFLSQTHPLDLHHQQQVASFYQNIQSLFQGTPPFQGQAADSLAELLSTVMHQEHLFTGQPGDVSSCLANATQLCQGTAGNINQDLQNLYAESSQYAYTLDRYRGVADWLKPAERFLDPSFPPDAILDAACVLPPSTLHQLTEMEFEESSWEGHMQSLGGQPPPPLPPEPDDPEPFAIPPLTTQQQVLVQDILQYLQANGISGIDQDDVENLVRLGYDRDTIMNILLAGIPTNLSREQIDQRLAILQARITSQPGSRPTLRERRLAYYLASQGNTVEFLPATNTGRHPDALVNGVPTEFKALDYPATSDSVRNAVQRSLKRGGQARNIIFDARGSGLTEEEARRAFARLKQLARGRLDSIRIVGDGFDITSTDFN